MEEGSADVLGNPGHPYSCAWDPAGGEAGGVSDGKVDVPSQQVPHGQSGQGMCRVVGRVLRAKG